MLRVEALTSGYGPLEVLHGVALTVSPGTMVSVLGANGAGKTTLLRAISGILPHTGKIELNGADISRIPAERLAARGLAHVPEGRLTFAGLTVRDNLELGAWSVRRARTHADQQAEMDRVLALFPALAPRLNQQAGTMSGGEQQMLAIGRSLMSKPTTLLLDEPSVGLAPRITAHIFRTLALLVEDGMAVLLVEQNARVALARSSHVYVLDRGRVVFDGTPKALESSGDLHAAYFGAMTAPQRHRGE